MKLIQILEIICVIKINFGFSCKIPDGVEYDDEILMTLSCRNSNPVIHFNETTRLFTKTEEFYRAKCDESNINLEIIHPNIKGMIFCAEENCVLPKALIQSENLLGHFNGSVITTSNQSEIYYCYDSQWYSLFQTDLPKEFELINEKILNMKTTNIPIYKPLSVVEIIHQIEKTKNETVEFEAELPRSEENDLKNHSFLFKFNSEPHKIFNLYEFVIVCVMICSFFFFLLVLLILLSKFVLINQVRRKFIKPNLLLIESEAKVVNNKKSIVIYKDFPVLREKLSSSESSAESKTTIYTSPSKHSKNIEANENS